MPQKNDQVTTTIAARLLDIFGIECGETLALGNVCETIYRARRGPRKLVVKLGIGERPAAEVRMNLEGSKAFRTIGAGRLLPDPFVYLELDGVPALIMEDCGPDFLHAVTNASEPIALYRRLVNEVHGVYRDTLRADSPRAAIERTRDRLVRQCRTHLPTVVDATLVDRVAQYEFGTFDGARSCFSTFDFTPEDVFLTAAGMKHADPLPEVLGIPVIDLACFAGVARDAYALPGSAEGYEILKEYALQRLPELLGLSPQDARQLFSLGRALQSALSARFRLTVDAEHASELARACEGHIRDFLS